MPTLSTLLRSLALSIALGVAVGLPIILLSRDWLPTLQISVVFSVVMRSGFVLLAPWCRPSLEPEQSPFKAALGSLAKTLLVYTLLLGVSALLIRVLTGLNLLKLGPFAVITFLIGLTITSIMMGLHTTANLVSTERARSLAEVESLRLQMLEADHARKTQELEEARQLQLSMLPKAPPECCGLAFAYLLRTATEVGGDTYDHRNLPDGSLLMAFGDATGHGLQAGLVVTAVKALFHTLPPSPALTEGLLQISEGLRNLHMPRMAMALTLLRLEGNRLHFAAAGMPSVLHFQASSQTVISHRTPGPPLGQLKHFAYTQNALLLESGDAVLLCSDGFPECLDPEDRMLGYDRMVPLFQRHAKESPVAMIEALVVETEAWAQGRPLADDLSFLVIRKD